MSKAVYPEPKKGALAKDYSNYAKTVHYNGPKDRDIWPLTILGGVVAFMAAGLWILSLVV